LANDSTAEIAEQHMTQEALVLIAQPTRLSLGAAIEQWRLGRLRPGTVEQSIWQILP